METPTLKGMPARRANQCKYTKLRLRRRALRTSQSCAQSLVGGPRDCSYSGVARRRRSGHVSGTVRLWRGVALLAHRTQKQPPCLQHCVLPLCSCPYLLSIYDVKGLEIRNNTKML